MEFQRVILCEGFHDRAFWKGMLLHRFRCAEMRTDPIGRSVREGQFGYCTPTGRFVRVVPMRGDTSLLLPEWRRLLQAREQDPCPEVVILNCDRDCLATATGVGSGGFSIADLEREAKQIEGASATDTSGYVCMPTSWGRVKLGLLVWECANPVDRLVPDKQSLERIVVAALSQVDRSRATIVREWLDRTPAPAMPWFHKSFAWSHMAGWAAHHGCEFFYERVWQDAATSSALENQLGAGAFRLIQDVSQ